MARPLVTISLSTLFAGCLLAGNAEARDRVSLQADSAPAIVEASPVLAPFQHVRFCLRYPADCKSDSTQKDRVELSEQTSELLNRVNRSVNAAITPTLKTYGTNIEDRWTIAPARGDCNDYAVTKRHELIADGVPARVLRLSVVKTASGIGHLVLVVATTKGDLVLDNLTDAIRPWQRTGYEWLKIQSAADARFWYAVKPARTGTVVSQAERKLRLASR
ncbi:MAG TPA: transglutaminase-like cysteine peptidase [Bradyrhizobium sp.]|nr:transglutaminase-like cysteine peptidase [Bradyrhizobium sp.]